MDPDLASGGLEHISAIEGGSLRVFQDTLAPESSPLEEKRRPNGISDGPPELSETDAKRPGLESEEKIINSSETETEKNGNGRHSEDGEIDDLEIELSFLHRTTSSTSSDSSWISEPEETPKPKPKLEIPVLAAGTVSPPEVLKLSPTRLGELLADTPTPFTLHPVSQSFLPITTSPEPSETSPPQGRHISTTTTNTLREANESTMNRPPIPIQKRTLSSPPSIRRSKSYPKVLHVDTTPHQSQRGRIIEKQRNATSPQKAPDSSPRNSLFNSGDGANDTPSCPVPPSISAITPAPITPPSAALPHPPTTTHLLKTASAVPTFPPLPIHSYLSLALSSPTTPHSASFPFTSRPQSASSGTVYGPPPHHPDDATAIAIERITNFIFLPPKLEAALWFGVLACLDSWLYMFTILPLRFLRALGVLLNFWWGCTKCYFSSGKKLQKKGRGESRNEGKKDPMFLSGGGEKQGVIRRKAEKRVSDLLPGHKADILRGLVVFVTCWVLMRFDASRMYHSIRGQNGIKLYVIYNVLEISDKLCSAFGQDVFEILFSKEMLERGPDGRSKVLKPFGFFLLALTYNILHSTALFYQVITLNVAVNSYSNALMTLLLSVQFVEIKSTVFKKFEKENLFQLTCADVVERFQLWLMLLIIASRNLVEIGVWSLSGNSGVDKLAGAGVLPKSFTLFPKWTGQVMGPFLLVLGSEMLVDWLKHAYITKFNNTRPAVYERFLDVLCRDYYSHAFADQNLTKRLGLPVIPLACLFIRASLQTYHMFLATHVPLPLPSATTSLSKSNASPATTDALRQFDLMLRRALGRSSFGGNNDPSTQSSTDDLVAVMGLMIFFLGFFLVFLAVKLVLGICLLGFARRRYKDMKQRERMNIQSGARRVGGFGVIEVSDDQRKWIYKDDPAGERVVRERERAAKEREMRTGTVELDQVSRYTMVAKRIW